jgi:hypothetical protein
MTDVPKTDTKKLRADVYDVVQATQRLLTQTTSPVAFYNAFADLVVIQRYAVQALPGAQPVVDDLNKLLDSIEKATDTVRIENRW